MDFWLCPARDVERRVRCGEQKASLLSLENLTRDSARRAVNPRACHVLRPARSSHAEQLDVVRERLAGEPTLTHERDLVFNTSLVARMTYASGVDEEGSRLRVLCERRIDRRVFRTRAHDGSCHVVEHDAVRNAAEERPRRIELINQRFSLFAGTWATRIGSG